MINQNFCFLMLFISVYLYNTFCNTFCNISLYQVSTSLSGVIRVFSIPKDDIHKCIEAYEYFKITANNNNTNTDEETEHVKAYYSVVNEILSIADIEKMYIPPQIDNTVGLYKNQLLWETHIFNPLSATNESHILDIGCGRGRIAHHLSVVTGARVSGFNIDNNQIENAKEYANKTNMNTLLDFQVGDHHKRFNYSNNTFDGAYSFEAVWPFLKKNELEFTAGELFRVLKPGGIYSGGEYVITPSFDWNNEEHINLHKLYMPTLAATQSNYHTDIADALIKVGFELKVSTPSIGETWPITQQKTQFIRNIKSVAYYLFSIGIIQDNIIILLDNLLLGGRAWETAEKMKLADLNWQFVVYKPE